MPIVKRLLVVCILLVAALTAGAQTETQTVGNTGEWSFQKYPAKLDFRGEPAAPLLVTQVEHNFRTQIRMQARRGPNFAGHFTVAEFGCGAPCLAFVIINASSGTIYDKIPSVGCANDQGLEARLDFKLESRLIAATGASEAPASPGEKGTVCGTNYYLWDGKRLTLVHFEPWPKTGPP
jgi:hypothetical protein